MTSKNDETTSSRRKRGIRRIVRTLMRRKSKSKLNRAYSLIADSEVTPGSLEVWSDLPEEIKNDPSLAPFRSRYEKQHGLNTSNTENAHDASGDNDHGTDEKTVSPATNGITAQHKMMTENNNIGSNSYYAQNLQNVEAGLPTVQSISKQNSKEDNTKFYNSTTPNAQNQSNQPISFLTTNMMDTPSPLNTLNKQTSHSVSNTDALMSDGTDAVTGHKKMKPWIRNLKLFILVLCWLFFTVILLMKNENIPKTRQLSVPRGEIKEYYIRNEPVSSQMLLKIVGPFLDDENANDTQIWLNVWINVISYEGNLDEMDNTTIINSDNIIDQKNVSTLWRIPLVVEEVVDTAPNVKVANTFDLDQCENNSPNLMMRIMMTSNSKSDIPIILTYNTRPINLDDGVIYAALVLVGLYILIVFEIVHRTFAAILASTLSLSILALLDQRPTTAQVISWIDIETILLLFSMMVLVAILSETGIFDYLAVFAYRVTAGRVWPLINCLCLFTAVTSSFLDNVTTVLLMTPVTIRLCEVMELNPVPILMSMVIFSNIGGTLTPVGDPPNVIIASNSLIQAAGINFAKFTLHMTLGVTLVAIQAYIHLRIYFRDMSSLRHSEPKEVQELRHEIAIWQRAAASLSSYSKDEDLVKITLMKKVNRLLTQLTKRLNSGKLKTDTYKATLQELSDKYPIRDKVLLIKGAIAIVFVITFFFLHAVPGLQRLSLGWTALLGAILLILLSDRNDIEAILARVEWSTLLFFAALFILMEALSKLGLINWIGKQTELIITSVSEESRLTVAVLLILWVSAIASAFVDNIPLTTMMIRIATDLGSNPSLNLPLEPLVWALAYGACLGGNGTLIGASANVVCAGVAEQHGYRFSFVQYFKVGFPLMLGSIVVITCYLLVAHVGLQWHNL